MPYRALDHPKKYNSSCLKIGVIEMIPLHYYYHLYVIELSVSSGLASSCWVSTSLVKKAPLGA